MAMRCDRREGEEGYLLVGMVFLVFLLLLALAVAAPTVARDLRREKELEAVHRGNQYVRAVQLYYRKMGGQYPPSMEALEQTNNTRFLRQRYLDPFTGKADWKLIHVGEAKTTVKGFFGKPLTGLAGPGGVGGSTPGAQPATGTSGAFGTSGASGSAFGSSSSGSAFGSSSGGGSSSSSGSSFSLGSSSGSSSGSAFGSSSSSGSGSTSGNGTSGTSGTSGNSGPASGGNNAPFVGVGLPKEGASIITLNEMTTYQTWEFIYDPRIEQLKSQASLFGGPSASSNPAGIGTGSTNNTGTGTSGTNGASGTSSSGSGFSLGGSFGGSSGGSSSGNSSSGSGSTSGGSSSGTSSPPQ